MLKLKRVDNMDIVTNDVQRLVDFYIGTLGLRFFLPYVPGQGWAAIDLGNLTLYLLKTELGDHAPRRAGFSAENPPGLDSFAFEVEDLGAAIAELDGRVEWVTPQIGTWRHPSGTHYRFRAFYDPDGNKLFVTEPHKVSAP
jgi:isopenicillin-N N-acyltransferase-like protein